MTKKSTIKDIKNYCKNIHYECISNNYYNSKIRKLLFKCPEEHEFKMLWNSFKRGQRCPVCNNNRKKLTYKYVKEQIEKEGYKLLSKTYKDSKSKLKLKCPKGHIYEVNWNNWSINCRCSICFGKHKLKYNYVKKHIEKEGYILLSKSYINNHLKLKLQCPKGHIYKANWNKFKQGKRRCPICFGKNKLTYGYVKEQIEKEGYMLLSKVYINNSTHLKVKCNKGHTYFVKWGNFHSGKRCPICRLKTFTKEDMLLYKNYRNAVDIFTRRNYYKYINIINNDKLRRGKKYHLDHIYSVIDGYINNIPIEVTSNIYNLRIIGSKENISKSGDSDISKKELYLGYYKFELTKESLWQNSTYRN